MNKSHVSSSPLACTLAHTFDAADVCVLLKKGEPQLVSVAEKERLLASGVHYGLLLTPETEPASWQQTAYEKALERNGSRIGQLLVTLLASILEHHTRPVLVSLARAGTPIGCVLRRIAAVWGHELPHYSLSILRGDGIDQWALEHIRQQHPQAELIFVDGWTGKGSIFSTLQRSLPADIPARLAVLSDPAGVAKYAATHDDFLLPHALLNATVCGLLSRTFRDSTFPDSEPVPASPSPIAHAEHAARIETHLQAHDQTRQYINALTHYATRSATEKTEKPKKTAQCTTANHPAHPQQFALAWAQQHGVHDAHLLKPSVGEATRVFLRRRPKRLLLQKLGHPDTVHLEILAQQRDIPVDVAAELSYLAAALIDQTGSQ